MNSTKCRKISRDKLPKSVEKPEFGDDWWIRQDNDPRHTARLTRDWFKDNNINVLPWPIANHWI